MRFYEFGKENCKTLILIHGMASTWKMSFALIIPELSRRYHLILVGVDGYNPEEKSEFISLQDEAEKIERFISDNFGGKLYAAYGSSLGSNIVFQLLANQKIEIKKAILDGALPTSFGIFSGIVISLLTALGVKMMNNTPKFLLKVLGLKDEKTLDKFVYRHATKRSIKNGFECSWRYHYPDSLRSCKAEIENWHGSREPNQKFARKKILKLIPGMKVKVFKGYGHCELLYRPKELVKEINRVLG